jgi:primosomal protein N' (replication factor Y)
MTKPNPQATSQAAVLMPALVEEAFDYLVPEGTREGALVEATLASRALVGVVWGEGVVRVESRESSEEVASRQSPVASKEVVSRESLVVSEEVSAHAVPPLPLRERVGVRGQEVEAVALSNAPPSNLPPQGGKVLPEAPALPAPSTEYLAPNNKKPFKLKLITRVIDDIPPLKPEFRAWIDWVSNFTLAPKGAVLSLCGLAHAAKTTRKKFAAPEFSITLPTLTAGQQAVVDGLKLSPENEGAVRSPKGEPRSGGGKRSEGGASPPSIKPILLDGVTGSGKTEVYFHLIAEALAQQTEMVEEVVRSAPREPRAAGGSDSVGDKVPLNQVLILLPEIALTHQWLERFEKTFGAAPVVWHSRMTPAAKARAWQAVVRGEAPIVVGARSALFLPFRNLKRIIVDEEHDPSYKQEEGVLYHARDMAVARAHFERIPILLVSATPSLETMENVREGKYEVVKLPERFGAAGLPSVTLVDMRINTPERGSFIAPSVKAAMLETLARGEQVLFFMNRRGYAPLLLCRTCGHRFACGNCSAWLVVHGGAVASRQSPVASESVAAQMRSVSEPLAAGGSVAWGARPPSKSYLACHHCGHKEAMPNTCPSCNAEADKLAPCGPGVERIAQEIKEYFVNDEESPRLAVLSSDEAINAETWASIEAGEVDILVGTQMVAKGHNFPRLTLVVVVDADVGLDGADLRAGERSYQLLHQLGGRAGRGDLAGTVLVQTYCSEHPVMKALVAHDRNRLMALEAKERKLGGWPPFGQLAAILLDGVDEAKVRAAGQMLARTAPDDARITVLGPAPAPLSKLRGQYRYRILIKANKTIGLQATLRTWLKGQKFSGVRIKVDVNPYYFM